MEILDILMNRDGMTQEEASDLINGVRCEVYNILDNGGSYNDIEELMYSELGLEMDYIHDIL